MPRASQAVKRVGQTAAGAGTLAFGCLAYAGSYEVNAFRLRRVEIPVLPASSAQLRVLHISDLHLTPGERVRQQWVAQLAALEPDLVIDTGDNIAHADAVPFLTRCLGRLLDVPGVYVWGSNDYFGPTLKNPLLYLTRPDRQGSVHTEELPWRDLGRAFTDAGWIDLNDRRATVVINGIRIAFRGTDDAHLNRDNYGAVAGPIDRNETDVAIGVTHAPYRRVLDPMTSDGHDLIVAGHTHGGQICVPFYGALVTNCDLDPARAKGLSSYGVDGRTAALHVSAGLGTSPYAPVRFACPPEATLMTLVPRRPT